MWLAPRGPMIPCMTGFRRLVVELELIVGGQPPIEGWARAPGLPPCRFSGWSEMFAALQTLACGGKTTPGGDDAGTHGRGGDAGGNCSP
jgi:hypothetical protein